MVLCSWRVVHLVRLGVLFLRFFFFFNDTATTEIYTLSLHDALPISSGAVPSPCAGLLWRVPRTAVPRVHGPRARSEDADRKSTRLNSSHDQISYAVFCLKKKNKAENRLFLHADADSVPMTAAASTVL